MPDKDKKKVRVERVDTKCGYAGHMTVEDIKSRALSDDVELTCPECGEIHLTPEDALEAEARKVVETERYRQVKEEAEES